MNEQVNLTNCDREPIHVPGSVQPFGFLLALVSDFTICMASENAPDYLGGDIGGLLQKPIAAVLSPAGVAAIRSRVDYLSGPDAVERMFGIDLLGKGRLFDLAIHFSGAYLVVEAEPSLIESGANSGELVRLMLGRIRKTTSMADLAQEAARQLKLLTGFDRVMVYRFHPDGSGEVIAEVAGPGLEPFLGLHYPASDIPRQARQLYQRNWLRIIADINAAPAPLLSTPVHNAGLLDLSMSVLRAVSPIHIEYLRNMGVAASMSVSILRDGKFQAEARVSEIDVPWIVREMLGSDPVSHFLPPNRRFGAPLLEVENLTCVNAAGNTVVDN
ncbi:MAG: GAF domain-containing protein, partial [Bradyrhizobium sp.]|nr:GAF domain-containing protein [Bradyrhizobium sp.]